MNPEEKNATTLLEEEVEKEAEEQTETPEAYGEIVIEEINIDGMCGVY